MSATFASAEWAAALLDHLHTDAPVRTESMTWLHGPIALVVDPDAEHAFGGSVIRMDIHEGEVRAVTQLPFEQQPLAPFVITGTLARWKGIFGGRESIVEAVLQARLRFQGDLPTIQRHSAMLAGIVAAGGAVATIWQDEAAVAN